MPAGIEPVTRSWVDYPIGRAHDPNDNAGGGELGVDLATPLNTPITTPWGGVVTYAGSNQSTGGIVKVATSIPGIGNIFEYFLHLNAGAVRQGQTVQPGQLIGLSGGTQPGAGGWPHVEFGLFSDPKYASQYWGFQSGSTYDPTKIVEQLHSQGGVSPAGDIWQLINGGAAGTAGLPPSQSGGQTVGQVASSAQGAAGSIINVTVNSALSTILSSLGISPQQFLWMSGLIILGGLLILLGVVVAILPNRQQVAQVGGVVQAVA